MSFCWGSGSSGAHPDQSFPATRDEVRAGPGEEPRLGKAWTRPRFGSRAEQALGGRHLASGLRAGAEGGLRREGARREESMEEGVRESVCARAPAVGARAAPRPRAPSPRPSPPPCRLSPPLLPPAPRAPVQPPESVQLLPCRLRIPPVPPSAASPPGASAQPRAPAQRSRPVSPRPSRGQPRGVASRPTRPAAEEREEDGTPAPPPHPRR